jgi:hypothetical protein
LGADAENVAIAPELGEISGLLLGLHVGKLHGVLQRLPVLAAILDLLERGADLAALLIRHGL